MIRAADLPNQGMLLQCTWKQVEPCGLRKGECCNRPAGVVLSWRLWVTAGAQRREKGHCGQCFPTCHPSLLCPVGMCALTTASWAPESQRKSVVLLEYCCRLQAVMTCNHHSPAITGGSPYCQGDFHSRLWFPLWYHRGSELPVLISTGYEAALKMQNDRHEDLWDSSAVTVIWLCFFLMLCLTHCVTVL